MMEFSHQIQINAPAQKVWDILIDLGRWAEFDPFCDGVDGCAALGKRVSIRTKLAPGRVFKVKVTSFDPPKTMVWSDGMPFGLFKGERTYSISSNQNGGATFEMREVFSGPMLGMIKKHLPDMSEAFASFGNGLKSRVEDQLETSQ